MIIGEYDKITIFFINHIDDKDKIDAILDANDQIGQDVIDSLQIIQSLVPVIHESLYSQVLFHFS
jgi:hypothetical protein